MGVVPVTECINHGFSERGHRKEGFVLAFKKARKDAARYREVTAQKEHRFVEEMEGVPFELTLVEELRLVDSPEAGQPELALRVVWQEAGAEEHHRPVEDPAFLPKPQTLQDVVHVVPGGLGEATGFDAEPHRAQDLLMVELVDPDPCRRLVLPTVAAVNALKQELLVALLGHDGSNRTNALI